MAGDYQDIVKNAVRASAAAGVPGAFSAGADIAGLAVVWGGMMLAIAKRSGHELDRTMAIKVASSAIASVAAYATGIKLASMAFHAIPGAGTAAAVGISSGLNMLFTLKFAKVLVKNFDCAELDLTDLGERLTRDLLAMFSFWTLFSEVGEAVALTAGMDWTVPATSDGSALQKKTFEEFVDPRR
jgi:uncharacterized protein (DUF697 family)